MLTQEKKKLMRVSNVFKLLPLTIY